MNPVGIPVFYGAFSEDVAVGEVAPSVGGLVAIGTFRCLRPLRLLDLAKLGVPKADSIFAPGYSDRASRSAFLRSFHEIIADRINPGDEEIDYVPTQAVAEYVRNVLGMDGIIFVDAGGDARRQGRL